MFFLQTLGYKSDKVITVTPLLHQDQLLYQKTEEENMSLQTKRVKTEEKMRLLASSKLDQVHLPLAKVYLLVCKVSSEFLWKDFLREIKTTLISAILDYFFCLFVFKNSKSKIFLQTCLQNKVLPQIKLQTSIAFGDVATIPLLVAASAEKNI